MARTHPNPSNAMGEFIGEDQDPRQNPGRRRVSIASRDPRLEVSGWLISKPDDGMPKPRFQFHERPGAQSLTQYVGSDPVVQTFVMKFDGDRTRSVEGKITDLKRFLQRTASNGEPPVVKVAGMGILHPEFNWRVTSVEPDTARSLFLDNGDRHLFVCTVTLTQQIQDRLLTETIRRGKKARGISHRTVRVRDGERTLYDVARRVFHDPSAAREIAVANNLPLSRRLHKGQRLRLP